MKRLLPLLFIMTACGGGGPIGPAVCQGEETDAVQAYIIDPATKSVDRRSVVQVRNSNTGSFCTGTVVGEFTVLTAAHCFGMDRIFIEENGLTTCDVVHAVTHPAFVFPRHDLQLLYTDKPLPGPYSDLGLFPECTSLVAQGYGWTHPNSLYEREVEDLGAYDGFLFTGEGACNGDSGGPLWATDGERYVQVGVLSYGFGEVRVCEDGSNGYVDINEPVNRDWLEASIR